MDGTLGVITCFAADFAPRNWATCDGQTLRISTNLPLFSLINTTYGGDGITTFMLPDLRGSIAVHVSEKTYNPIGKIGGSNNLVLIEQMMPAHSHNGVVSMQLSCNSTEGADKANSGYPSKMTNGYAPPNTTPLVNMLPGYAPATAPIIGNVGLGEPVNMMPPYQVVNFVICTNGVFPSRP